MKVKMKEIKFVFLIGNGFDIQLLNQIGMSSTTSYQDFYNFINWKYPKEIKDNIIVNKMKVDRESGNGNWSDFENSIKNLLRDEYEANSPDFDENKYIDALSQLQNYFSDFLNTIITTDVLKYVDDLGEVIDAYENKNIKISLPLNTLRSFLYDLKPDERGLLKIAEKIKDHIIVDYTFFNFNYTPLFDNYITLDKDNFDPHVHKGSDNNFHFQFAKSGSRKDYYTKIRTRIFHPHGFQHTPRSMLFGFDNPKQVITDYKDDLYTNSKVKTYVKYFLKPYWAENKVKYGSYLEEADLFVVFGHSIGESDRYWWNEIYKRLEQGTANLIIYNYTRYDDEDSKNNVKNNFISSAGVSLEEIDIEVLKRIFVINFDSEKQRFAFTIDKKKMNRF